MGASETWKLDWETLLTERRRKDIDSPNAHSMGTSTGRNELERDFDRILFAAPTRRLADKTQVFPLEANDSVRNRLTHSHEVSNLARSIGVRLVYEHGEKVFRYTPSDSLKRGVPSLLAAVGLAHDIGNPPFGHQGEEAIRSWFKLKNEKAHSDFLQFNGNAQSFRLLTRLQVLNDNWGLNLACSTLAALMKYPCASNADINFWPEKFCVNDSEKEIASVVWNETGLEAGVRHPLAFIMEACDDIAYSVIDAEDTVKKECASFNDLVEFMERKAGNDVLTRRTLDEAKRKHKEASGNDLSSSELNDVSMQYFRVKAIHEMILAVTDAFLDNLNEIMGGQAGSLQLVKVSEAADFCKNLKKFDLEFGFKSPSVLRLELKGDRIIRTTMDYLWEGIQGEIGESSTPFSRYAYGIISENYRRVFNESPKDEYCQMQLLADAISGMTDSYLVSIYRELKELKDGSKDIRRGEK